MQITEEDVQMYQDLKRQFGRGDYPMLEDSDIAESLRWYSQTYQDDIHAQVKRWHSDLSFLIGSTISNIRRYISRNINLETFKQYMSTTLSRVENMPYPIVRGLKDSDNLEEAIHQCMFAIQFIERYPPTLMWDCSKTDDIYTTPESERHIQAVERFIAEQKGKEPVFPRKKKEEEEDEPDYEPRYDDDTITPSDIMQKRVKRLKEDVDKPYTISEEERRYEFDLSLTEYQKVASEIWKPKHKRVDIYIFGDPSPLKMTHRPVAENIIAWVDSRIWRKYLQHDEEVFIHEIQEDLSVEGAKRYIEFILHGVREVQQRDTAVGHAPRIVIEGLLLSRGYNINTISDALFDMVEEGTIDIKQSPMEGNLVYLLADRDEWEKKRTYEETKDIVERRKAEVIDDIMDSGISYEDKYKQTLEENEEELRKMIRERLAGMTMEELYEMLPDEEPVDTDYEVLNGEEIPELPSPPKPTTDVEGTIRRLREQYSTAMGKDMSDREERLTTEDTTHSEHQERYADTEDTDEPVSEAYIRTTLEDFGVPLHDVPSSFFDDVIDRVIGDDEYAKRQRIKKAISLYRQGKVVPISIHEKGWYKVVSTDTYVIQYEGNNEYVHIDTKCKDYQIRGRKANGHWCKHIIAVHLLRTITE